MKVLKGHVREWISLEKAFGGRRTRGLNNITYLNGMKFLNHKIFGVLWVTDLLTISKCLLSKWLWKLVTSEGFGKLF
jgi:hypothetical protein